MTTTYWFPELSKREYVPMEVEQSEFADLMCRKCDRRLARFVLGIRPDGVALLGIQNYREGPTPAGYPFTVVDGAPRWHLQCTNCLRRADPVDGGPMIALFAAMRGGAFPDRRVSW